MIKVLISRDELGYMQEFEVKGHAGYNIKGQDIVCAAVSAIIQTAIMGLTEILNISPHYKIKDGWVKCVVPSNINTDDRAKVGIILDTMAIGLKSIRISYDEYISIEERKVD